MERLNNGEVVLNRWIIDDYIGSGRYGVVYRAHDAASGQVAAVKIISLPNETQIKDFETLMGGGDDMMEAFFDQMAGRFVAEVESLKRLNHTNSIRYIDHAASKRGLYWDIVIVMEYANTLTDYMDQNPLTYGDIFSLAIGITSVLERCNELKILHRDIKEDNLFIGGDGVFKIGDFGAANMSATGSQGVMTNGIGSPYYMAPEVETSERYTGSVDIYSLGIVLYRLLNYKRFPFMPRSSEPISQDDNARAYGERRSGKPLPAPEFCPDKLVPVILKACAFNPNERYLTASDMKRDLLAVLSDINTSNPELLATRVTMPAARVRKKPIFQAPTYVETESEKTVAADVLAESAQGRNMMYESEKTVAADVLAESSQGRNMMFESEKTVAADVLAESSQGRNVMYESEKTVAADVLAESVQGRNVMYENEKTVSQDAFSNIDEGTKTAPIHGAGFVNQQPPQEQNQGMKTTDAIREFMKKFGNNSAPVSKMREKIQALDNANAKIRKQQSDIKKKKRNVILVSVLGGVLMLCLILSMLFGVDYRSNKNDGNQIYRYYFSIPTKNICPDDDINAWYVISDSSWVYFSWHNQDWGDADDLNLYRVNKNGAELERVCTDRSEYLMPLDGYIYYINTNEGKNPTICRVAANSVDGVGEVLYSDTSNPVYLDDGIDLVDGMIKFSVYDASDSSNIGTKYLDVHTMTFYNEK